jgi:hypothetical protein
VDFQDFLAADNRAIAESEEVRGNFRLTENTIPCDARMFGELVWWVIWFPIYCLAPTGMMANLISFGQKISAENSPCPRHIRLPTPSACPLPSDEAIAGETNSRKSVGRQGKGGGGEASRISGRMRFFSAIASLPGSCSGFPQFFGRSSAR